MSTLEATTRAFATFAAGYPSAKKMDESTVRFWSDELRGFANQTIEEAARRWVRTERYFPNLPNFIAMCRELRPADEHRALARPSCGICEDGWIETDADGRSEVTRCPSGCLPAGMGERVDFDDDANASPDWPARLHKTLQQNRDRVAEIGADSFLIERGFDPSEFRWVDGMILAKVPQR